MSIKKRPNTDTSTAALFPFVQIARGLFWYFVFQANDAILKMRPGAFLETNYLGKK